jgi:hypothetical protein
MMADKSRRADWGLAMSSKIVFGVALALASLLLADIGSAEEAQPLHKGPWPIRNGHNYQPTEHELRNLHLEDVTPDQAREIDRLYDQLLASSERVANRHPAPKHWSRCAEADFRPTRLDAWRCFCGAEIDITGTD